MKMSKLNSERSKKFGKNDLPKSVLRILEYYDMYRTCIFPPGFALRNNNRLWMQYRSHFDLIRPVIENDAMLYSLSEHKKKKKVGLTNWEKFEKENNICL